MTKPTIKDFETPALIRETRLSLGFTQQQCADMLHINISTWQRYETDWSKPSSANMPENLKELFVLKTSK